MFQCSAILLLGDQDLLLAQQLAMLLADRLAQPLGDRPGQFLVTGLAQEGQQAQAQVGQAKLARFEGFIQQGGALAVGAAQVGFGHVRLDHRQVASLLQRQRLGLLAGDLGGLLRGAAFAAGQGAVDATGGHAAATADLGARAVGRGRRQRIAADLAAAFAPAIDLLLDGRRFPRPRRLGLGLRARDARAQQEQGGRGERGSAEMRHDSPLWQS
ncbi:hypothetical protein [Thermomonas sp.]|uniref:hypothetical protein n=1 Tax=Thermomonas sp. TaxID=1971895 RepID=UPI0035B43B79